MIYKYIEYNLTIYNEKVIKDFIKIRYIYQLW